MIISFGYYIITSLYLFWKYRDELKFASFVYKRFISQHRITFEIRKILKSNIMVIQNFI